MGGGCGWCGLGGKGPVPGWASGLGSEELGEEWRVVAGWTPPAVWLVIASDAPHAAPHFPG